jgi:two-component system sensor histidine kinase/response regulator
MGITEKRVGFRSNFPKGTRDNQSVIVVIFRILTHFLFAIAFMLMSLYPVSSLARFHNANEFAGKPEVPPHSNGIQSSARNRVPFNARELAWLQNHKTVKIGSSQYPPLAFKDEQGSFSGISADYLSLIAEKTGLRFETEYLVWPKLIQKSKNKEIDLFSGLKDSERDQYLNFTSPYLKISYVVINRLDSPFFSGFYNLNGLKVSVVKKWTIHDQLKNQYPNVIVVPYDSLKAALKAVSTGEVEAYVGDLMTASYEIRESVLVNLKVVSEAPFKDDFVRFAVRHDWPELVSILEKSIESISRNHREAILNKWFRVKYIKNDDYSLVVKWATGVSSLAVLIIIIISFWNRRLKREINFRKLVESELERAKTFAEDSNKSKSEFLANMSHEIRTPLNGTLSMAKLLEGTDLSTEQHQYVDAITFSGESLLLIINDILDISKIEAGKLALEITAFELEPIIEGITKLLTIKAKEQSSLITYHIDKSIPPVLVGDAAHLRQILFNLIGNAIKFTKGGEVKIEVTHKKDNVNTDNVILRFEVIDNGIGIPQTIQPQIFNVFVQADSSTSRTFGGSGLGLSICHRLVALMGGVIGFETTEGLGTTFWFELPLFSGEKVSLFEVEKYSTTSKFRPLNILLVEDDLINQIAGSTLLEKVGHQVTIANDGYAALEMLTRSLVDDTMPFGLILVDVRMPGMSGQETAAGIRQMPESICNLPIIALTADVTVENISACYAAGIDRVLSKPINLDMLTSEIQALSATSSKRKPRSSYNKGQALLNTI